MKKLIPLLFHVLFLANVFPFGASDIRKMTFENGLSLYLIEDASSALVSMEIRVDAGYDFQTERTAGFVPLYARLKGAEISQSSVSKRTLCAPNDAEESLYELSTLLDGIVITDKNLKAELNAERESVKEYALSASGFINAAIEARLFPENPWKHGSGINPDAFSRISISEARTILDEIEKRYTPKNTRLYICGNITAKAAEIFALRAFSRFRDEEKIQSQQNDFFSKNDSEDTFFVLHDSEFSPEMAQIVTTWTNLSEEEADIAAVAMNEDFSDFKARLLSKRELGIRSAEYIDATSIQNRFSSRLTVQTLLEQTDESVSFQIKQFLSETLQGDFFSDDTLEWETMQYTAEFSKRSDSASELLFALASWHDKNLSDDVFFNRIEELSKINADALEEKIRSKNPFVFVLLNSTVYEKNAKSLKALGFQAITRKNGAWWTNEAYKKKSVSYNALDSNANPESEEEIDGAEKDTFESAKRFVEKNRRDFSRFSLSNGIPVVFKKTGTNTACLAITILGGEKQFAKESPGLMAVFANALALNIRAALDRLHVSGETRGAFSVGAKTDAVQSVITVTFSSDEFIKTVSAVSDALIFGDITPALADGLCYDERMQWRLKIGSAEFQELAHAMRKMYAQKDEALLFVEDEERPKKLEFDTILENYPKIVDSSKLFLVLTGDFDADSILTNTLDLTFGSISSISEHKNQKTKTASSPDLSPYTRRVQLRHVFLTDISADKAGPKPAVLIPTTRFLDPITFIFASPKATLEESARFNALGHEIARRMQEKAQKKENSTRVKFVPQSAAFLFSRLVALNATKTGEIDRIFLECVSDLQNELEKIIREENEFLSESGSRLIDLKKNATISKIESAWLLNTLNEESSAEKIATLIQEGIMLGREDLYLFDYASIDSASAADYLAILLERFSTLPPVRIYSVDSQK